MAEIQASRFTQLLRRIWSLKSKYTPTLLEDVFPTFQIHDPTVPSLERLRGVKLLGGSQFVTGAAGFIPAVLITAPNPITGPAGTPVGVIFDVYQIIIGNPNASSAVATIEHGPSTQGVVGAQQLTPQDGRDFNPGDAADQARSWTRMLAIPGTFAGTPTQRSFSTSIAAGSSLVLPWRATLANGSAILVKLGIVAGLAHFSFIGTERVTEPSENF